jgi:hypothetical protein
MVTLRPEDKTDDKDYRMTKASDKRKFNRFTIDFMLTVYAEDNEGKRFEDKTSLNDVSGEGAKFLTHKYERYFLGQVLEISIILPGTDEIEAYMKAKATVVRIDPPSGLAKDQESQRRSIAVKFETHLNFQKMVV